MSGAAGGMLASGLLGPALARAATQGPRRGSIKDVEHIVVLMQENRSFDHYFGTLSGVRGFGDPNVQIQPNGKSVFYQPDPQNPDGYLLPWHLDTQNTSSQAIPSTSHAWAVQHSALNITVGSPTSAGNNNWLPAHLAADGSTNGPFTMGYYEREDIPFHFALAESFTLLDGYHCSLLGPTWPNRMYLMTGMIDPNGLNGGPIISNVVPSPYSGEPYTWTTYPERLTQAGISWRVYQEEDDYGTNMLEFFAAFQNAQPGSALYEGGLTIYPADRFEWDAKHNKLPTVSWIVPTSGQSEHPSYIPASGADYLASKLNAVAGNEDLWPNTVFIVNYDENDGLFDHVTPPLPPAGTPDEFVGGLPIGGGVRVPAIIVSPWTVGGYVATENFDHTSVLQFMEQVTGVSEPNISAWRRETFGDLSSALGFSNGSTRAPALPATIGQFWNAEEELATLPAATPPGANQTAPVQETSRPRLAWSPQRPETRSAKARGDYAAQRAKAMPRPSSRLVENATTHAADFQGGTDKVLLARLAEVSGRALTAASGTILAYIPGITGGTVAIVGGPGSAGGAPTLASAISSGTTNPYGIATTPDGTQVWVTESGTNTVTIWNTLSLAKLATVVVGVYPHGIVISPDGTKAFVANTGPNTGSGGSQTVSVVSVASATVTGTVEVGEAPQVITMSPTGSAVYVSCADGVYSFPINSYSASGVGGAKQSSASLKNPHGVTVSPDATTVWVADSERDQIVILDATSLDPLATVGVGDTPWNTAFSADGASAYVANLNDDTVSVIDTATRQVTTVITLGSFTVPNKVTGTSYTQLHHQPSAIATAPDATIWVANNSSSSVALIDPATNAVTGSLELGLGDDPTGIAFVKVP
jgi:phospholipase C